MSRNSANNDEDEEALRKTALVRVLSTGYCMWTRRIISQSNCDINVRWFPFDDQLCELIYESWNYDVSVLNVTATNVDLDNYTPNGEWQLIGTTNTTSVYGLCSLCTSKSTMI